MLWEAARDIAAYIREIYDTEISPSLRVKITNRIIPEVQAGQKRPLDAVYPIVRLDAMFFKVKDQANACTIFWHSLLKKRRF